MLGDKIKLLRKDMRLTQEKLATSTGISRSSIGMAEKNLQGLSNDALIKLADFFGVSLDYLLKDDEQIDSTEEIKKERDYSLSIKEQETIDDEAKKIIDELSMSFSKNKDSLSEDDYFAVETAIRTTLEAIKIKNKKKFTPKKFR